MSHQDEIIEEQLNQALANSRVRDAAPELLDALRYVSGYVTAMQREGGHANIDILAARIDTAIAKAEGK